MKVKLICIGSTKKSFFKEAELFYKSRIDHYIGMDLIYLPDVKGIDSKFSERLKEQEGKLLMKHIHPGDQVILLDEKGKDVSSKDFSKFVQNRFNLGGKQLVFLIGGAFGFSGDLYARADAKIRLSAMTFPHDLVRLVFLEQFYRALTILKGEPYHHL